MDVTQQDDWDRAMLADPGLAGIATLRDFDLECPLVVAEGPQ